MTVDTAKIYQGTDGKKYRLEPSRSAACLGCAAWKKEVGQCGTNSLLGVPLQSDICVQPSEAGYGSFFHFKVAPPPAQMALFDELEVKE